MAFVGEIEGRKVYLFNGQKSQTVRVCDERNRYGDYEWTVRVAAPARVTRDEVAAHETVAHLVRWLQLDRGGAIESDVVVDGAVPPVPPDRLIRPMTDDDPWIEEADRLVRRAIDQLLEDFVRAPYLHRVEHSLHTRLITLLTSNPLLGREFPISGGTHVTQPVHKEWPETVPEEGTRRGSFDVAVLPPGALYRASIEDFISGYVEAPIVVEMGLDYGLAHLLQDVEKLLNSDVRRGYIVHFTRVGDGRMVEEAISKITADRRVAVAYAGVRPAGVRLKRLNDTVISECVRGVGQRPLTNSAKVFCHQVSSFKGAGFVTAPALTGVVLPCSST